jgi:peptidoglycan-associated lipoprotein
MSKAMKLTVICMLCLVMVVAIGGCCKKKKTEPPVVTPTKTADNSMPTTLPEGGFEPSSLPVVFFDFDSSALRPDAVATLNANADVLKGKAEVKIQVEGHCDERGTQEYNLALGERRALAVRDYLIKVGVAGERISTISYGEEKPAVDGHDEAAWGKNRRAQFNKGL